MIANKHLAYYIIKQARDDDARDEALAALRTRLVWENPTAAEHVVDQFISLYDGTGELDNAISEMKSPDFVMSMTVEEAGLLEADIEARRRSLVSANSGKFEWHSGRGVVGRLDAEATEQVGARTTGGKKSRKQRKRTTLKGGKRKRRRTRRRR